MILNSPDIALRRRYQPLWLALAERLDTYPAGADPGRRSAPLSASLSSHDRSGTYGWRNGGHADVPARGGARSRRDPSAARVRTAVPPDDHRLPSDEDKEPEFGQALITHGREAGGGDERAMVGTIARMLQIDALDDNRYALIAVGTRRIAVNAWLPDDPYPIADVDEWPDDDPDAAGLDEAVRHAHDRVRTTLVLAAEIEGQPIDTRTPQCPTTRSSRPITWRRSPRSDRPIATDCWPRLARWSGCDARRGARRRRRDVEVPPFVTGDVGGGTSAPERTRGATARESTAGGRVDSCQWRLATAYGPLETEFDCRNARR